MMAQACRFYNEMMRSATRALAAALLASLLVAGTSAFARADTQNLNTGNDPVILIAIAGQGDVTVRPWDRAEVAIDADPSITVQHIEREDKFHQLPPVTFFAANIETPSGPLTLAPEPFVPPPFDPFGHDIVRLTGTGGNVTIHIPQGTPYLATRVRQGAISINGFHGGTMVAEMGAGQIRLNDDAGTAAVQLNFGPVVTTNSTFDRLRIRTARGPMYFDNCTARQIEATSLMGTIVYDNSSFQPGLARFETEQGNIALGIRGGAQIAAHSESGSVNTEGAIGGGPAVTAMSRTGNIVYYTGALKDHPNLARQIGPRTANRTEKIEERKPVIRPSARAKRKCC